MFWHNVKYNMLAAIRDKAQLFWSFLFVALLGTFFYVTFGKAYYKSEIARDIPVAVYLEDEQIEAMFDSMIEGIEVDDGSKMLEVTEAKSMEEAEDLLRDDKVVGIFYTENHDLKLMVRKEGIRASILTSVVSGYHKVMTVTGAVVQTGNQNVEGVVVQLLDGTTNNKEIHITDSNMDVFTEYFYNLLAMACLFASFAGITITIRNQANLSDLGARKCISQTSSFVPTVAALFASCILLYLCELLAMGYLIILGVNFGTQIPQILLLVLIGTMTGLSLGFFIGNLGKISENSKQGLGVGVSLTLCFFSGLMVGDMKYIVEKNAPWFNRINPAALICDSFSALNVFEDHTQYWINIGSLCIISVVLTVGGILLGRRRKYASL